ncbi:hypothetical protein SUGI_0290790 [Cryptomeria japonica]|nr:hypothetical protein SUGI_0290790 [Cryptomeria japonica]
MDNKWMKEKVAQVLASAEDEIFIEKLSELEEILKYKFKRRNLMEEALTHSSVTKKCCKQLELLGFKESEYLEYMNGMSYERLEFVGDAVLGHLITVYLYRTYPGMKPGILTRLRSENVKNETLARVAVKHGFFNYLRFECPDLPDMIEKFIQVVENESKPHLSDHSKAPKILADMVESIVGAVFVDSGNSAEKVWEVFEPLLQPLVGPETLEMHPVAELQEICQRQRKFIEYRLSRMDNLLVSVDVYIDGQLMGSAKNERKDLAKRAAARNAFLNFKNQ